MDDSRAVRVSLVECVHAPTGLTAVDPLHRPTTFSKRTADSDSSEWTETPAEKAQRMVDEVAGIKRPRAGVDPDEERRVKQRDEAIRRGVEKHSVSDYDLRHAEPQRDTRGASLMERHKEKEKDTEPEAVWDHARDMGMGGRVLDDNERSAKIRWVNTVRD